MDNGSKLRLLYIEKMLQDTDEQHPLTNSEMMSILADQYGISTHRTTIPADIDLLIKAGMEIETIGSRPKKYYLNDYARCFSIAELKMLIDSVESSKFITKTKSEALVEKITSLAPPTYTDALRRNLWAEGRIKQDNEKIYYSIETINRAINERKKVTFQYFRYDVGKKQELRDNGFTYVFSPYALVWNGDFYYIVGFCEKHGTITSYRIDRIAKQPCILDEEAVLPPPDFDIAEFTNGMFHMYNSERRDIQLVCDNVTMDAIIDKFGCDVETTIIDDGTFGLKINAAISHVFFSWIFGFEGRVRIVGPEDLIEQYRDMINKAAQMQTAK